MDDLSDTIAIVTGAASGIGAAVAARLTERGATVVVVDLDGDAAAATAERLHGVAVAGSVDDPATWDAAIDAAEALGGLDVVHLNAGLYGHTGPIDELPLDLYAQTVGANIGGVVLGVRAAVPAMRRRGGGHIVATASVAGIVPFAGNPLYTLTKHAVVGFVAALAPGLAADGITVGAVCPAIVDTPMTTGALGGMDADALGIPLIDVADVVDVVVDLATTDTTGRLVAVSAGAPPAEWTLRDFHDLLAAHRGDG